ncbi:MAG: Glycerophosphoryl diester phosphodiesterase [Candidatus Parcubacteria bacterium]|jgi:glycerophosphoryl diester phosphodiesterase
MAQIVGHRGAAGYAPENTLLAFQRAMDLGCKAVEMDARLSKDGVAVVFHDAKVDRMTDGRGLVKKMTVAQLKALRCPHGQRIPTLQEVIDLCKGKAKMLIELKAAGTADAVARLVAENGIESEVVVLSFKIKLLKRIKRLNPRLKVNYLFFRKPLRLWGLVKKVPLEYIGPRMKAATPKLVDKAHALGRRVYVYVVNSLSDGDGFARLNVDAICTDYPKLFLHRKGRRK